MGGQIISENDVDMIRTEIGSGKLNTWDEIHTKYNVLWEKYPLEKQKHAFATLCYILETDTPTKKQWLATLQKVLDIQEYICEQVFITRNKDFENPFRKITYRNEAEMTASIGTIEDNSFVKLIRTETDKFKQVITKIIDKEK